MRELHRLVPLVVEEFGRLGDHAEAFLHEMAQAATANRSHLQHLPDDHPALTVYLQKKLNNWRQRISSAVNCIHAVFLKERLTKTTERCGERHPLPNNIMQRTWPVHEEQLSFQDQEQLEALDDFEE